MSKILRKGKVKDPWTGIKFICPKCDTLFILEGLKDLYQTSSHELVFTWVTCPFCLAHINATEHIPTYKETQVIREVYPDWIAPQKDR